MTSRVHSLTLDTPDPYALASWWSQVLGVPLADDDFPGDPAATLAMPPARMLFLQVDDAKTVKNRLHLDLVPDVPRDEEVARLLELGATLYDDQRRPDGSGWVVLADPEGNEFCIERSEAERAQ